MRTDLPSVGSLSSKNFILCIATRVEEDRLKNEIAQLRRQVVKNRHGLALKALALSKEKGYTLRHISTLLSKAGIPANTIKNASKKQPDSLPSIQSIEKALQLIETLPWKSNN